MLVEDGVNREFDGGVAEYDDDDDDDGVGEVRSNENANKPFELLLFCFCWCCWTWARWKVKTLFIMFSNRVVEAVIVFSLMSQRFNNWIIWLLLPPLTLLVVLECDWGLLPEMLSGCWSWLFWVWGWLGIDWVDSEGVHGVVSIPLPPIIIAPDLSRSPCRSDPDIIIVVGGVSVVIMGILPIPTVVGSTFPFAWLLSWEREHVVKTGVGCAALAIELIDAIEGIFGTTTGPAIGGNKDVDRLLNCLDGGVVFWRMFEVDNGRIWFAAVIEWCEVLTESGWVWTMFIGVMEWGLIVVGGLVMLRRGSVVSGLITLVTLGIDKETELLLPLIDWLLLVLRLELVGRLGLGAPNEGVGVVLLLLKTLVFFRFWLFGRLIKFCWDELDKWDRFDATFGRAIVGIGVNCGNCGRDMLPARRSKGVWVILLLCEWSRNSKNEGITT